MQISLRYLYTKVAKRYPETKMALRSGTMPHYSSLGVLGGGGEAPSSTIYVDLATKPPLSRPDGNLSIITSFNRAWAYQECDLIVVPDDLDMVEVSGVVSKAFSLYMNWAGSICEAVAQGADLQRIIDLTSVIVDNPMYFADSSFRMLASRGGDLIYVSPEWRYQKKYHYLPYNTMRNLIDTGELSLLNDTVDAFRIESKSFPLPFVSKSIRKDGVHHGYFFIIELYDHTDEADLEIADYLGTVLSSAMSGGSTYLEMSKFYHAHFIEDIIEGNLTDEKTIADQMMALGLPIEGDHRLFMLDTAADNEAIRHHIMALLTSSLEVTCLEYHDQVLAIIEGFTARRDEILNSLRRIIAGFGRDGALSEMFIDFRAIGTSYAQDRFVIEHVARHEGASALFFYEDLYIEHLIELSSSDIPLFSPARILEEHDRAHGTQYCETMHAWISHDRNLVKTAQALFIHRNTLVYRLEKVGELIDVDLDDPSQRIRMYLSLTELIG